MFIKNVRVQNFKSFETLELQLNRLNILIGANASGKSNFISLLKFIKDIALHGLDNAVSMQGGIEYLRNTYLGNSINTSIEISIGFGETPNISISGPKPEELTCITINEINYKFELEYYKRKKGFKISQDELKVEYDYVQFVRKDNNLPERQVLGPGKTVLVNNRGNLKIEVRKPDKIDIPTDSTLPILAQMGKNFPFQRKIPAQTLILEHPWIEIFLLPIGIQGSFASIPIYDFDPKLAKKAIPVSGKKELEEDGSNLAIVLKHILSSAEDRRKFSNIVKDILPFVANVSTEKFAGQSLIIHLKEIYAKDKSLPAFLISDGTMNITALILALYFEKKPVVVFEEIERGIHPSLISRVIDLMVEVSKDKQIFVTTHNPQVIKHAPHESILLVSRDKSGFSTITRPLEREEIQIFLQNDLGVEDLYVQNMLEL